MQWNCNFLLNMCIFLNRRFGKIKSLEQYLLLQVCKSAAQFGFFEAQKSYAFYLIFLQMQLRFK